MVLYHCDNKAVMDKVNSGYSRDRNMIHLLHCLFLISEHHFLVEALYLPEKRNIVADALSCNNAS